MKKIALLLFSIIFSVMPTRSAQAHVLITDMTDAKAAILHINPDDDPVAGEETDLFFDIQDQVITAVSLNISDQTGRAQDVPLTLGDSLATATYIFPAQGVYRLLFTVDTSTQTHTFEYTQRVMRGAAGSVSDRRNYAWAEILLLASGIGILVLVIVALNCRKDIAAQSRF